ncbi:MAG: sulfur carrier protein ThiS adenylyltransferase ThiF [Bacteroidales bacterium]|nr:sulfur carrier protein ThiS adenylyltransferase ThiF [Bacteroidales bacterium]
MTYCFNYKILEEKLKNKTVGIAGCGGLGSNCAVSLARSGVGNFIIADFDVVSKSNLNRQYYFLDQIGQKKCFALKEIILKINPNCSVIAYDVVLNKEKIIEIYKNVDVLVEAFDESFMKQAILETKLEHLPHIPLVMGNGVAGIFNINNIKETSFDNVYIFGDGISEVSENNPCLAPKVSIVANMQANKVIELLLNL